MTEQVEDVKVFLNMMKIICSMAPAFMLDIVDTVSSINNRNQPDIRANSPLKFILLDFGICLPSLLLFPY